MNDRPSSLPLAINGARLWHALMQLAELGATPKGGVCRLALTDLDRQARERVIGWAREAGCTIRVDAIGNIFARRAGREDRLRPTVRCRRGTQYACLYTDCADRAPAAHRCGPAGAAPRRPRPHAGERDDPH